MNPSLYEFKNLQKIYQPDLLDFEFSVGYILQATRNGFFSYMLDETIVIYTCKEMIPHSSFVIIAATGKNRIEAITQCAYILFEQSQKPVYLKNVSYDEESLFKKNGFLEYDENQSWDSYSKYDDNTYPQQVVDATEYRDNFDKPKYSSLREEVNRFYKHYMINVSSAFEEESVYIKILKLWSEQMNIRNGLEETELLRSHMMFQEDFSDFIKYYIKNGEGNVLGFVCFSQISSQCVAFNVLINDFSYRNLYRIIMYEGIKIAHELGYRYCNLQGSEDLDQYKSKRRFKADIEIVKKHLVYKGRGE